jgi:hypothetical protein
MAHRPAASTVAFVAALLASQVVAATPPRLGPRVGETLNALLSTRALSAAVPSDWSVDSLTTSADRITLSFSDRAGQAHVVELRVDVEGPVSRTHGKSFAYALPHAQSAAETEALYRAAALIDAAVKPDAFVLEQPEPAPSPPAVNAAPPPPPPGPAVPPLGVLPPKPEAFFDRVPAGMTMPTAGALATAIVEALLLLAALLFALRSGPRSDFAWAVVLFLAALWTIVRTMGLSPTAWEDTLIENLFVRDCLTLGRCTMVGATATVGIFHSAGYLHGRALLEWLGVTPNGTHALLLAMTALGVSLSALAAARLQGRVAAAGTALLMMAALGVPMQLNVISDAVPLPFLGALFFLAAVVALQRPSLGATALLGLVGGVTANIYVTGLLCGVSAVWIAFLIPERRRTHVSVAVASFALSAFLLSPVTWIVNAQKVFGHHVGVGHTHTPDVYPMVKLMGFATAAWVVAAVLRPTLRRALDVPVSIFLPLFVPFLLASGLGWIDAQDKYCGHVTGAVAAGVVIPIVEGFSRLFARVRWGDGFRRSAPYVAAALIAVGAISPRTSVSSTLRLPGEPPPEEFLLPTFTYDELVNADAILMRDHHWSWADLALNLKMLDDTTQRAAFRWPKLEGGSTVEHPLERAYLFKASTSSLPTPLPKGVAVIQTSHDESTFVASTCSWVDWRTFQICVQDGTAPEQCLDGFLPADRNGHTDYEAGVRNMPDVYARDGRHRRLTLRFGLKPDGLCPEEWVYLPKLEEICPGRIVAAGRGTIEPSGRVARLKADVGDAAPQELAIAWNLDEPDCWTHYRGHPPFFVEGDPPTVTLLRGVLERYQTTDASGSSGNGDDASRR